MAIRNIRELGDDILRKKCRNVDVIDDRILVLLEDMADTLYDS
ncbi:MAG: peptide deformylase, partial [Ruminococcaceae bacterium]|nr:peptide deformylase [Oscillospiraceae bacterium]